MAKPKAKGKRGLDDDRWNELLACFRRKDTPAQAAVFMGIDVKTAKKAFYEGYAPGRAFPAGKPPMQEKLDAERALESAETSMVLYEKDADTEMSTAERLMVAVNKAASEVINSHGASGVRIHLAAKSTEYALASAARLQAVGDELAKRMVEKLNILADPTKTKLEDLNITKTMGYLREIARFTKDAAETMRIVDELERRHLGSPEDIRSLLVDISRTEQIPEDEADHIISVGMQILGVDEESQDVQVSDDIRVLEAEFHDLENWKGETDEDAEDEAFESGAEGEEEEGSLADEPYEQDEAQPGSGPHTVGDP